MQKILWTEKNYQWGSNKSFRNKTKIAKNHKNATVGIFRTSNKKGRVGKSSHSLAGKIEGIQGNMARGRQE